MRVSLALVVLCVICASAEARHAAFRRGRKVGVVAPESISPPCPKLSHEDMAAKMAYIDELTAGLDPKAKARLKEYKLRESHAPSSAAGGARALLGGGPRRARRSS